MPTSFLVRSAVGEGLPSASWTRGVLVLGVVLLLSFTAKADQAREYEFDIPQQGIETALSTLATQAGALLLFPYDLVQPVDSKPVSGRYTVEDALAILLEGTGLTGGLTEGGVITISRAGAIDNQGRTIMAQNDKKLNGSKAPTKRRGLLGMLAVVFSAGVGAQDAADVDEEELEIEEIVVTGTNIRGIAPDSSPSIVLDRDAIDATGFQSTELLIRSLPQAAGGGVDARAPNGLPALGANGDPNSIGATGINLRGVGAGATLTLLNGRRLAPAGIVGGFTDISAIPLSAVERVEVLSDGASAIYGADAIGGVVNFVLREDFEGVETQLSYGGITEGSLDQYRLTQLAGTQWGSGNILASYEFFGRDALRPDDKSFLADAPPIITVLPDEQRHSGILSFRQNITEAVEIALDGYYASRETNEVFTFGRPDRNDPVLDYAIDAEQFLISPAVTAELFSDWQLAVQGSYAKSSSERVSFQILPENDNPPNMDLNNEATIRSISAIADGTLIELPAGPLKVAVGGEYREEEFRSNTVAETTFDREVTALFSEVFIPIVSDTNKLPLINRFEINAAVRYDDYSDFGDSVNPKAGILWSPTSGLNLRGSYGTSFNPPDLGELLSTGGTFVTFNFSDPNSVGGTTPGAFYLGPTIPNLGPEESENFSVGLDYSVDIQDTRISLSSTYYSIEFDGLIAAPPAPNGSFFNARLFPELVPAEIVTANPEQSLVDGILSTARLVDLAGLSIGGQLDAGSLEFLYDYRDRNLAKVETRGLDFTADAEYDSNIGIITVGLNGSYVFELSRQTTSISPTVEFVDTIFNPADLRLRGQLGWGHAGWNVNAFVNYTDGYIDNRADEEVEVDSYTTVDINIRYDLSQIQDTSFLNNSSVSLGVINLFEQDPPSVINDRFENVSSNTRNSYDPANADPLGRFVFVEVRKRF